MAGLEKQRYFESMGFDPNWVREAIGKGLSNDAILVSLLEKQEKNKLARAPELAAMGFPMKDAERALEASDGAFRLALHMLLSRSLSADEDAEEEKEEIVLQSPIPAAQSVPEMGRRVLGHALSINDPFAGNSLLPGRMPAANVRNDDPFGGHILFDARKPVPANVRSVFDLAPPTVAAQQSAPISSRRPVKLTSTGNLTGNFQLLPSYGEGVAAENAAEMRRQIIQLRTAGDINWGDQGYIVGVSP